MQDFRYIIYQYISQERERESYKYNYKSAMVFKFKEDDYGKIVQSPSSISSQRAICEDSFNFLCFKLLFLTITIYFFVLALKHWYVVNESKR